MFPYDYIRPTTIDEACLVLADQSRVARPIAGGTDLMVQIHEKDKRWSSLELMVDLRGLEDELRFIREEEEELVIGALATHTDIETSALVQRVLPCLSASCGTVGSPQIRNIGTIGGSICNASPASDPLPTLILADAKAELISTKGKRTVELADLYADKGALNLLPGEILHSFRIPKLRCGTKMSFVKLGRRKALAISRLNVAVALYLADNGCVEEARIAPGCVFKIPTRVKSAEQLLIGKQPTPELFEQVGEEIGNEMIRLTGIRWSTEYKQPAVQAVVFDALTQAMGWED